MQGAEEYGHPETVPIIPWMDGKHALTGESHGGYRVARGGTDLPTDGLDEVGERY